MSNSCYAQSEVPCGECIKPLSLDRRCCAICLAGKEANEYPRCNRQSLLEGTYCQQHQRAYIQSYTNYKQLSNEVSTYAIMKPGTKIDFKALDTLEGYSEVLQRLVPMLRETIALREQHGFLYHSYCEPEPAEDTEEGHIKIIKTYTVLLNLFTPIYNKWQQIIQTERQTQADVKGPLIIEPEPEFPYYVPTLEQRKQMDQARKAETARRQVEREKLQAQNRPQVDTKIPVEKQSIPVEYYASDVIINPINTIETNRYANQTFHVCSSTLEYTPVGSKDYKDNGEIELSPIIMETLYTIVKVLNNFRAQHMQPSSTECTDMSRHAISSIYKKYLNLNIELNPYYAKSTSNKARTKARLLTKYTKEITELLDPLIKVIIIETDNLDNPQLVLAQDKRGALHKIIAGLIWEMTLVSYFSMNPGEPKKLLIREVNKIELRGVDLLIELVDDDKKIHHHELKNIRYDVEAFIAYYHDNLNYELSRNNDKEMVKAREHMVVREMILNPYRRDSASYYYYTEVNDEIRDEASFKIMDSVQVLLASNIIRPLPRWGPSGKMSVLFALLESYGL